MSVEFDPVVQPESASETKSILQLPTEIIIEIFRAALSPWSDICSLELVAKAPRFFNPLNLGKVCKSWRELAWSIPWVWDTVYLNISCTRYDVQVSILEEWLSRAGTRPLSICVAVDCWHDPYRDVSSLMRCIVAHSNHWQAINLFLPLESSFPADVRHYLPMLKYISIRPAIDDGTNFWETTISTFLDAPLLDDVEISSFFVGPGDFELPWGQLKRFNGRFCSSSECAFILQCAPNLRSCQFIEILDNPPTPYQYTAARLEILKIVNSRSMDIRTILQQVILPSLLILEISTSPLPQTYFGLLKKLFQRSVCSLQRLSLDRIVLLEGALISCLETVPTLSELEIITSQSKLQAGNALSDRFICSLHPSRWRTVSKATNILLPRLEIFKYTGYISFTLATLHELLSSRWHLDGSSNPEIAKLTHVSIRGIKETKISTETNLSLRALVAEGLELTIQQYDGLIVQ